MQYVVVSLYRDCVWPGGGITVLLYFCYAVIFESDILKVKFVYDFSS